jgi:hypothetical protein
MVDYDVNSAVILMTLGGIVLGLAFLGCCGACTGNYETPVKYILEYYFLDYHVKIICNLYHQ